MGERKPDSQIVIFFDEMDDLLATSLTQEETFLLANKYLDDNKLEKYTEDIEFTNSKNDPPYKLTIKYWQKNNDDGEE